MVFFLAFNNKINGMNLTLLRFLKIFAIFQLREAKEPGKMTKPPIPGQKKIGHYERGER